MMRVSKNIDQTVTSYKVLPKGFSYTPISEELWEMPVYYNISSFNYSAIHSKNN